MIKLDVCLEMVFPDLPYEKRIEEISKAGYDAVEFWFHDATLDGSGCSTDLPKDAEVLRDVCKGCGVTMTSMVVNAPDGSFGGAPVAAQDFNKYIDRLHEVIEFSKAIGVKRAITCAGNVQEGLTRSQMRANLEKAYSAAADVARKNDFTLLLEPLNTHVDHAGYYLDSSAEAAEIVRQVNSPSFKLLYDVYHMQVMEGNVIANVGKNIDIIGHFHIAGVPGRGEVYTGELDYSRIIAAISGMGYDGYFGLEYSPSVADHRQSLKDIRVSLGA